MDKIILPPDDGETSKKSPQSIDLLEAIRKRYGLNAATYALDPENPNEFYDGPY